MLQQYSFARAVASPGFQHDLERLAPRSYFGLKGFQTLSEP